MLGRKVKHKVFGCGTITELTSAYLTVNFGDSEKNLSTQMHLKNT